MLQGAICEGWRSWLHARHVIGRGGLGFLSTDPPRGVNELPIQPARSRATRCRSRTRTKPGPGAAREARIRCSLAKRSVRSTIATSARLDLRIGGKPDRNRQHLGASMQSQATSSISLSPEQTRRLHKRRAREVGSISARSKPPPCQAMSWNQRASNAASRRIDARRGRSPFRWFPSYRCARVTSPPWRGNGIDQRDQDGNRRRTHAGAAHDPSSSLRTPPANATPISAAPNAATAARIGASGSSARAPWLIAALAPPPLAGEPDSGDGQSGSDGEPSALSRFPRASQRWPHRSQP